MPTQSLLYKSDIQIADQIAVQIPKLRSIISQEDNYYGIVSTLTATPYDMMVQLDDKGVDFTSIDDYELFLMTFESLKSSDTSLVFGDLDLSTFHPMISPQNNLVVLRSPKTGLTIDKSTHVKICHALRTIHGLTRNNKMPGNDDAKDYLLKRERRKLRRKMNRVESSQLEELIVALVNTEQFSYNYDSVLDLTIYQFNESVRQIVKKIDFDNRMHGVYSGTVSVKDINPDELNWMKHK